jgi:hypothetical protein
VVLFAYATKVELVARTGAKLKLIVTTAQMMAAKSEANCVRVESVILNSF